jgi:hypothetical protein
MIFGMTLFTFVHVVISLIGIAQDSSSYGVCSPQNGSISGRQSFC